MTEIKEIDDTVREEIPERIPETCKEKRRTVPVLKPRDGLMIAFFVPVLVMICIFAQRGIFPFGERCFLRTDMYHQYAPFFSEFQYKLRTGGSLLYSWDVGMGVNFAALYAYYLASPLRQPQKQKPRRQAERRRAQSKALLPKQIQRIKRIFVR